MNHLRSAGPQSEQESGMTHAWIPSDLLQMLRLGHATGRELLVSAGYDSRDIESVEAAEMVEVHRWAWKPKQVRLMLVAESHVYTKTEELAFDYGDSHHIPRDLNVSSRLDETKQTTDLKL